MHESISREHALIVIDDSKGPLLFDLDSAQGTFIDGKRIEPHVPYKLSQNLTLKFG